MSAQQPILVTGAAGQVGGIGGAIVKILLERQVPVRAFVRRDDERADALRRAGAEIFVGDLTRTEDLARAVDSCRRAVQLARLASHALAGRRRAHRSQRSAGRSARGLAGAVGEVTATLTGVLP